MKIYFAGSISAGRHDADIYFNIISILKNYGEVLTEFIGNDKLSNLGESEMDDKTIHDRDMRWLLSSDLLVAEVTTPSLGVGYEIGRALENKKKIICFYREIEGKRLSAMIKGADGIITLKYNTLEDLEMMLEKLLS